MRFMKVITRTSVCRLYKRSCPLGRVLASASLLFVVYINLDIARKTLSSASSSSSSSPELYRLQPSVGGQEGGGRINEGRGKAGEEQQQQQQQQQKQQGQQHDIVTLFLLAHRTVLNQSSRLASSSSSTSTTVNGAATSRSVKPSVLTSRSVKLSDVTSRSRIPPVLTSPSSIIEESLKAVSNRSKGESASQWEVVDKVVGISQAEGLNQGEVVRHGEDENKGKGVSQMEVVNEGEILNKGEVLKGGRTEEEDGVSLVLEAVKASKLRCRENIRPDVKNVLTVQNGTWQLYNYNKQERMYIYSAHFDPRPSPSPLPSLRLLLLLSLKHPSNDSFACHVWYDGVTEPLIVTGVKDETGANIFSLQGRDYFEYTLSCPLPFPHPIPTHVTVAKIESPCSDVINYTTLVPVLWGTRGEAGKRRMKEVVEKDGGGTNLTRGSLAAGRSEGGAGERSGDVREGIEVCVTNGYGSPPVAEFVEWMELNLMFGVTSVTLYDTDYNVEDTRKVFEYYRQKGVLSVHRIPHPLSAPPYFPDIPTPVPPSPSPRAPHAGGSQTFDLIGQKRRQMIRNLRSTSLNDCGLRAAARGRRWIIVIDIDEVIVPRHDMNYTAMLDEADRRLARTTPADSYTVTNMYFLTDFPEDTLRPAHLKTLRFRSRALPSDQMYAPKSIIDPMKCFNVFNHYCMQRLMDDNGKKPTGPELPTVFMPAVVGTSHHYRKCGKFYYLTCDQLFKQKRTDNIILKFESQITDRVNRALIELVTTHKHRELLES